MCLLIYTLFLILSVTETFISNHHDQVDTRISLGNCIVEGSKRFFTTDFATITYLLPSTEVASNVSSVFVISHYVLGALHSQNQWTFLIKHLVSDTNNFSNHPTKSSSYIIQIRQRGEFANNLKKLKLLLSWNPHAKFLIVSATIFTSPEEIAMEITKVLWKQHILDAAILLADPKNTTTFNVYSWQPFSDKNCGDELSNSFPIDKCSDGTILYNIPWFSNTTKNTFNNCTIKAKFIVWPPYVTTNNPIFEKSDLQATKGIEVNLLNMIAEYLNLFVLYLKSTEISWGLAYPNGTMSGDFKLLANDNIDLVLGGYIKTFTTSLYFDSSTSYIQENLVWCVPHEPILLGLKPMITILSTKIWILLIFLYIIVTLAIWKLSNYSKKELGVYKKLNNVFLNNFLVLIGFATQVLPKSKGARFFIGLLIIFSLHLNILYTSYLTSTLSSHSFKEKYNKIEYIYNLNLKTYFIPESIYYFTPYNNEDNYIQGVALSTILQNWNNCYNVTYCVGQIIEGEQNAFCLSELYKEYLFSHVGVFYRRKHKIFCLKDQVVSSPVNLIMRKGFPLYHLFQKIIDRISNAGFISKWEKDILYQKKENIQFDKDGLMDYASIKFINLEVIFVCLIFGHFLSIFIFVGELIVNKKNKMLRKTNTIHK